MVYLHISITGPIRLNGDLRTSTDSNVQSTASPTSIILNRNTPRFICPNHRATEGGISARHWNGNPINGASRPNNGRYSN